MAKAKKKRNKKYQGADAASIRPNIVRVQAVSRSPMSQWLHERKRLIKMVGVVIAVVLIIVILISGIISLF